MDPHKLLYLPVSCLPLGGNICGCEGLILGFALLYPAIIVRFLQTTTGSPLITLQDFLRLRLPVPVSTATTSSATGVRPRLQALRVRALYPHQPHSGKTNGDNHP